MMNRKIVFLLVVAVATFGYLFMVNGQNSNAQSGDCEVTSKEVKENAEGTVQIIDVRTEGEYKSGHVQGAENIDIYSSTFKSQIGQLDKEKSYYVYCKSGGRSAKAQKIMKEMGFKNVCNVDGGVMKLQSDGVKLVK